MKNKFLKNIYYFNIFSNKKNFETQYLPYFQINHDNNQ